MTDKIRTTHTGSLPRPAELAEYLRIRHAGHDYDKAGFDVAAVQAIEDCVKMQVEAGVDIVSDGEMSKVSYSYYVQERLEGLAPAKIAEQSGAGLRRFQTIETVDPAFPDFAAFFVAQGRGPASAAPPVCTGTLSYKGLESVGKDIQLLKAAVAKAGAHSAFMTAASPGVVAMFASRTSHYATEEDYVFALAEAMRPEYEAIARAGVTLQIDCPDLALAPQMNYGAPHDFNRIIARNIEALNLALANVPREGARLHLCWGNYPGPHARDLEVRHLFGHLRNIKPQGISFEAANPRHEHEWEDWRAAGLADDTIVIPGVIDSTTNFIEHPRLVAQRIRHFVDAFGRERVIAGVDCGFGTFGTQQIQIFPTIAQAKLKALAEGAAMV